MTDLVSRLVSALEDCIDDSQEVLMRMEKVYNMDYHPERLEAQRKIIANAEAALTAAKADGWVDLEYCTDGESWFALSCGHVMRGYKSGSMLTWDEEDDRCMDASVIKCHPITRPNLPKDPA